MAAKKVPRLTWLRIKGYRAFKDFKDVTFGPLEVIVGANGSGKTSLFELLRFIRDGMKNDIPPGIIEDPPGRQIFHIPGEEEFEWRFMVDFSLPYQVKYTGQILGPRERFRVSLEKVERDYPGKGVKPPGFMSVRGGRGSISENAQKKPLDQKIALLKPNRLALSTVMNPAFSTLYNLREYIRGWELYDSFNIAVDKIRRPTPIEQDAALHKDCRNLSSVLHFLMTEHGQRFDELQQHIGLVIPGFKGLTVKARGGPGEVIAFWRESAIDSDLSLADLSEGILRFLCWAVICLHPKPPTLVCIDEPELGVHPRTMPVLAGLFQKACERTQFILATHSSYFLTQFDISEIAVMRKENGEAKFIKPGDSAVIKGILEDFGPEEIEALHLSDELERLP